MARSTIQTHQRKVKRVNGSRYLIEYVVRTISRKRE